MDVSSEGHFIRGTFNSGTKHHGIKNPIFSDLYFLTVYYFQVENVQLKFVLLLQQHICSSSRPSASSDSDKPVSGQTVDSGTGSGSSDLVRLLMVPSILRQMVELAKEMLVI